MGRPSRQKPPPLSRQVLPDSRLQLGAAGAAWTAGESETWSRQALRFLNKRSADAEVCSGVAAKKAKKEQKVERQASYDTLQVWQNGLCCHGGQGLERFELKERAGRAISFLALTMDWQQSQWCPLWYCRNQLGLMIEGIPDYTHARHRNLEAATGERGEKLTVAKAHCCHNVQHGPMAGSGVRQHHGRCVAFCVPKLRPIRPLAHALRGDIKMELSLGDEYECTEGRRKFLAELPGLRGIEFKPPKFAHGRWCSFQHGWKFIDSFVAVDNEFLSYVCIKKVGEYIGGIGAGAQAVADVGAAHERRQPGRRRVGKLRF